MPSADSRRSQEGFILYIGAHGLKNDYLRRRPLPRTSLQQGWYVNSVVLKPMADDRVFASLMLVRNSASISWSILR